MSPFVLLVTAAEPPSASLDALLGSLDCRLFCLRLDASNAGALASSCPDLIVLHADADPGACLARLRQWRRETEVPVVLVCDDGGAQQRAACWESGAADVIALPASATELRGRLALHLALARVQHGAPGAGGRVAEPVIARQAESPARQPKILLVDDSPANIHLLVECLRGDYKILAATCGSDALAIAQREQPDLVLLDIVMPDMDGHEVVRRLKSDPRTEPIPVIFITGMAGVDHEMAGLELGAIDYIVKPFSVPLVQRRLRTHLDQKRYRDQLQRQSMLDAMTGIPNRRCFDQALEQAWSQAAASGAPIALVMIDIDHFKAYNDHGGHPAGDACLRRVASALSMAGLRSADLVARYGGEEFACILPDTDIEQACIVAARMHAAVSAMQIPHPGPGQPHLSLSLGVACLYPGRAERAEALLDAADRALYKAKQAGRNRVRSHAA
ncbi:MAG: diguanylate cyclase [Pseudomonadota bacterium]